MTRFKISTLAAVLFLHPCFSPSLLADAAAVDKAKQKRTISDIRSVGVALMSWLTDQVTGEASVRTGADESPEVAWTIRKEAAPLEEASHYYRLSHQELTELLVPDYIGEVPERDAWGHPYEFALSSDLMAENVLGLRSPGSDGRFDTDDYEVGAFDMHDADRDIVWCDGYFVRWPTAP